MRFGVLLAANGRSQPTYRGVHPAQNGADMHEMAITQSVVDAVCEHAAGRRVHSVKLEVGALCAVVPDAMGSASNWPPRAPWPPAPARHRHAARAARCRSCGASSNCTDLILLCPCGSADVEVLAGRDLRILSMEVS